MKSNWLKYILASVTTYVAMIWRVGYHFGDGDQEEVLGQILYRLGEGQMAGDFLISSVGGEWTVRSAFVTLMSMFGVNALPIGFLIVHILVNVLIFILIIRIAREFSSSVLTYFLPILSVVLFYAHSPGGNDLYDPHLISSSIGMLFGVSGILLAIRKQYAVLPVMLVASTFFHPILGVQLLILILAYWLTNDSRSLGQKSNVIAVLNSVIGVGAIVFFFLFRSSGAQTSGPDYFDLMFRFRNPHHYLPSSFPTLDLFIAGIMVLFSFWVFRNHRGVKIWLVATVLGMLIYAVAVEWMDSVFVAKSQWFKSSIWFPMWFGLACIQFSQNALKRIPQRMEVTVVLGGFIVMALLFAKDASKISYRNTADPDLVEVSEQFRTTVSGDNFLVIQPIHITGFQYASAAPLYVSFKSILHYPDFMSEWFERLTLIYGDLNTQESGFKQFDKANEFYHSPNTERIERWKDAGITHMLTTRKVDNPSLRENYSKGVYTIYEIK